MNKSKAARLIGFIGALGGSALLLGAAATGTGAYFTDAHDGTITASAGHMQISTSGINSVDFSHLNPGEIKSNTISYHTDGNNTTPADIWLYFPDTRAYEAFTGAKHNALYDGGGLGQYGRFAVSAIAGNFNSFNLANDPATGQSGCANANGHGGNHEESGYHANDNGYCGVPRYILLQQNVGPNTNGQFDMSFGLQKSWTAQDTSALVETVPFKIVATQPGVRPDDAYNGSGQLN